MRLVCIVNERRMSTLKDGVIRKEVGEKQRRGFKTTGMKTYNEKVVGNNTSLGGAVPVDVDMRRGGGGSEPSEVGREPTSLSVGTDGREPCQEDGAALGMLLRTNQKLGYGGGVGYKVKKVSIPIGEERGWG